MGGAPPQEGNDDAEIIEGILWNLRTWPLELIDWPVTNSHRVDIRYSRSLSRFETPQALNLIPANERRQLRWNADPYDVTDGGAGMSTSDPGAWLLPYWMARHHSLVAPPQGPGAQPR